jgi:hypothetical protein
MSTFRRSDQSFNISKPRPRPSAMLRCVPESVTRQSHRSALVEFLQISPRYRLVFMLCRGFDCRRRALYVALRVEPTKQGRP